MNVEEARRRGGIYEVESPGARGGANLGMKIGVKDEMRRGRR